MRVSEFQIFNVVLNNLQRSRADVMKTQEQISTGKRVNRPSDDPVSYNRIMLDQSANAVASQRLRNIDFGSQRLDATDGTLNSVNNVLGRLGELSVQMRNATIGSDERNAGYSELRQLVQQLQQLANTSVAGQPLFSGGGIHGRSTGLAITAPVTLTNGVNDTLVVSVDGVTSGTLDLTSGVEALSGAQLAARVQARINADATLSAAGKSVNVTFDTDHLVITSNSSGSSSTVEAVSGTSLSALGLNGGSVTTGASPYAYRALTSAASVNTGGATIAQGKISDPNNVSLNDYLIHFTSATTYDVLNVSAPVAVSPAQANTGGAVMTDAGVRDPSSVDLDNYRIDFTSATQYTITDTTTSAVVSAGNVYSSGGNIDFRGLRVVLSDGPNGAPKAGDSFTVGLQPRTVSTGQTYASGGTIAFDGVQVKITNGTGAPAGGDLFRVQTALQYQGDSTVQNIEIGDNQTVKTNLPGSQVFTGPTVDLFASLKSLASALTGGYGAGLDAGIAAITSAQSQVGQAQGEVGALSNRLSTTKSALEDAQSFLQTNISQEQDADIVKAISDLTLQQTALQAAAQSASTIFSTSLMNFLK
ncbi:MAG TPA: flagellar hook-associated protein FlgL [Nitrospirales bacterium]|nr:flagellar hook-associated protein FlgL [Nitrospirales bacterium]